LPKQRIAGRRRGKSTLKKMITKNGNNYCGGGLTPHEGSQFHQKNQEGSATSGGDLEGTEIEVAN